MDSPEPPIPDAAIESIRGRGAQSGRVPSRFGLATHEPDGDWCDYVAGLAETTGETLPKLRTSVIEERPKSILTFNRSPDIGFDRSVNAYRGCEHGCVYCFARPTHAFHDLSPGLDFETKLFAKPDAADILRRTLAKKGYAVRPIAMGTNTDPYQPIEDRYRITRSMLEVMLDTLHPVGITTKSARILRDLDLLVPLAKHNLVGVAISVTTLDPALARILEPRASAPHRRVAAITALKKAGVRVQANIAPIIPAITDSELETIGRAVHAAGADNIGGILVRLPHEVAPLFREWLDVHFPDRKDKVMNTIRAMRGGRDNDPRFGHRFRPQGAWGELMRDRMARLRRELGYDDDGRARWKLRTDLFQAPNVDGQMKLL